MSYIAPANWPLPPAPTPETPSMPPPAPTLETPFTSPSTPTTPKTPSTPPPAPATPKTPSTSPPTPATPKNPSTPPPAPTTETPSTSPSTPATPKNPSTPPPAPTTETPSTSPPTQATPKTPFAPPSAPTPETPSTTPPTPATPKTPSPPPPAPPTPATPKTPFAPPPTPTPKTPSTSPPTPATPKTPFAPPPAPTPKTPSTSSPTPATPKTPSAPLLAPTPETSSTSPPTPVTWKTPSTPPPAPTPETSSMSSPAPTPETPSTSPLAPATSPLPPPSNRGKETDTPIELIVGIVIGGIIMLVAVVVFIILRRRRNAIPPQRPKDDSFAGTPHQFQLNAPPPADKLVPMPPNPTRSPQIASNTQPSQGHVSIPPAPSSTGNGLDFEKAHPPLSPGISFGFIKSTFTYEELAMATDGFSDSNFLGQGGFGYVHKGVLPNKKQVAIKQLKVGSKQGENEFKAEVKIISRIHHKHLVSLVGYYISGAQMMLVYDFIPNNTLEFHLHGKGRPTMSWEIRMKIALGSAKGLAYLHEECQPKIIHRDIKAANILLDYNFEAKVADFGLAKFFADSETHISTRIMGTLGYLAPEYALSGLLTEKSDIFSFGVVLLELITGRRPVDKTRSLTDDSMVDWARPLLTQALEDGNFDTLVDPRLQDYNYSEMTQMVACAAVCVRHSARRRPRMSQIVRTLEGNISLADLNKGIKPGHSTVYSPFGSSDYDSGQQHSTGELSVFTSERFHYY